MLWKFNHAGFGEAVFKSQILKEQKIILYLGYLAYPLLQLCFRKNNHFHGLSSSDSSILLSSLYIYWKNIL
jgi:hypothetical protein